MVNPIQTETRIRARPGRVWEALTDFPGYRQWNPFIWNAVGEARPGGKLLIQMRPPGGNALRFYPRVRHVEPDSELIWVDRMVTGLVFRAEYRFRLEPGHRAETRLFQSVQFGGAAAPLVPRVMYRRQREGLELMAHALREWLESGTQHARLKSESEQRPQRPFSR